MVRGKLALHLFIAVCYAVIIFRITAFLSDQMILGLKAIPKKISLIRTSRDELICLISDSGSYNISQIEWVVIYLVFYESEKNLSINYLFFV